MEPTLYVDEGEESRRVEELLQRKGLSYRRIDVDGQLLGWLLLEYGVRPPILVMGERVLKGSEIERLVDEVAREESAEVLKQYRRCCW